MEKFALASKAPHKILTQWYNIYGDGQMNERKEGGYRLTTGNLIDYIKTEYGSDDVKMVKAKKRLFA